MIVRPAEPADEEQVFLLAREFATSFAVERDAFCRGFTLLLQQNDARLTVAARPEAPRVVLGYLLGGYVVFPVEGERSGYGLIWHGRLRRRLPALPQARCRRAPWHH